MPSSTLMTMTGSNNQDHSTLADADFDHQTTSQNIFNSDISNNELENRIYEEVHHLNEGNTAVIIT